MLFCKSLSRPLASLLNGASNFTVIIVIAAHIGPAACLLVVTYAGCDRMTAVAMMILALTFNGAACQTSLQNHQDLAPNFAGSLYGIMNTFGSFSGFIIPAIIGGLTNEHVSFVVRLKAVLVNVEVISLVKD